MDYRILPQVEDSIREYRKHHRGETPLYIILQQDQADHLIEEVKRKHGFDEETVVTEYEGIKIVGHLSLKNGEIRVTNELPETGS